MNIVVKISEQKLFLYKNDKIFKTYSISSSKYGEGNEENSFKTPIGKHIICEKIGGNAKIGSIFISRKNKNEIAKINYSYKNLSDKKDIITSRILRLEGLEIGKNKGFFNDKLIDTKKRYVYIHGTSEEFAIGKKVSKGCIRMKNKDIIKLFDSITNNINVNIIL